MLLHYHVQPWITGGDLDGDGKHKHHQAHALLLSIASSFSHFNVVFFTFHLPTPTAPSDYFVLWDDTIIKHLMESKDNLTSKARQELLRLELPTGVPHSVDKETKLAEHSDCKWLSKAQDRML